MAGYAIFLRHKILDEGEMETYANMVPPSIAGRTLKPLVRYGPMELLEGESVEGVVVVEFPTTEDARAWYNSPEYQTAAAHRKLGAEYTVLIVEGVENS